ncbi:MAG: helix-turn-helix transcriptional regulator [Anaerolineaceae bacterium]|nr:helix-turn-helix transcriptional regulator [Anaerolineaceae bacterium]
MNEIFTISDLETLKVLSDPLRASILEKLIHATNSGKQLTVKQIAEMVAKPPGKLYYHVNLMEKHQLIDVSETRLVSNILEKHYQARSNRYHLDPNLLSSGSIDGESQESLISLVSQIMDSTMLEIRQSIQRFLTNEEDIHLKKNFSFSKSKIEIRQDQFDNFHQRLHELIEEFETFSNIPSDEESLVLGLTTTLYPIAITAADQQNENDKQ